MLFDDDDDNDDACANFEWITRVAIQQKRKNKILFHFPNHWLNWNKQLIQCVFRLPNQNQMMRKFNFQQPKTDMVVISNPEPAREKSILIKSISKNQLHCSIILIRSIRFDAFWFYEGRERERIISVCLSIKQRTILISDMWHWKRFYQVISKQTKWICQKKIAKVKNVKNENKKWIKCTFLIETESIIETENETKIQKKTRSLPTKIISERKNEER